MKNIKNARPPGPSALVKAGEPFTSDYDEKSGSPQPLVVSDWILVIGAAERLFGRLAAVALWHESPLPRIDRLPLLEMRFFEERVVQKTYGSILAEHLFEAYVEWCLESGCEPLTASGFGRAMTKLGVQRRKSSRIIYQHIALRRRWAS